MEFLQSLKDAMEANGGKIPVSFIDQHLNHSDTKVTHVQLTPNTRVCVITLTLGPRVDGVGHHNKQQEQHASMSGRARRAR